MQFHDPAVLMVQVQVPAHDILSRCRKQRKVRKEVSALKFRQVSLPVQM